MLGPVAGNWWTATRKKFLFVLKSCPKDLKWFNMLKGDIIMHIFLFYMIGNGLNIYLKKNAK